MSFQCDLNCPAGESVFFCCAFCHKSKKHYIPESNKHLWTKTGFWTPNGCSLSRTEMPQECKEYDCKNLTWVVIRKWIDGEWKDIEMYEKEDGDSS